MKFSIKQWDKEAVDLNLPSETPISKVKATIIDGFLASCNRRVLRDEVLPSAITLRLGKRTLEEDQTLAQCGITPALTLRITRTDPTKTRKRYGNGFSDDPDIRLELRRQKAERRDQCIRERYTRRLEAEEMAEWLQHVAEREATFEEEHIREREKKDEGRRQQRMREELIVVEEAEWEWAGPIHLDNENEVFVEYVGADPAQEADVDKENWDPQILRELAA